jgi:hypothetical protein
MVLMGILGFLQATLLPGLIIVHFLPYRGWILVLCLCFALSLLANFELVFLLTALGLYTRPCLIGIIAGEFAILGWLYFARGYHHKHFEIRLSLTDGSQGHIRKQIVLILRFVAILCFLMVLIETLRSNPASFYLQDDIVSWNRWATEWYQVQIPSLSYLYPQLIPANWSLTYAMMGSAEVHLFAKMIMALFPLALLLLFVDEHLRTGELGPLVAMPVLTFLLFRLTPKAIGSGYVDIAVAFLASLAFYLLQLTEARSPEPNRGHLSVALSSAAAGLCKQAGLFVVAAGFFEVLLMRPSRSEGRSSLCLMAKRAGLFALISVCCVGPWYLVKGIEIARGQELSNIGYLGAYIHAEKNPGIRMAKATWNAVQMTTGISNKLSLANAFKGSALILSLGLAALSLTSRRGRRCMLLVGLPYYLIWAAFYSYDFRNLTLALPFLSRSIGYGVDMLTSSPGKVEFDQRPQQRSQGRVSLNTVVSTGLSLFAVVVLWGVHAFPSDRLIQETHRIQRNLVDPILREKLYDYYHTHGLDGKILTTYPILLYLPEFRNHIYTDDWRMSPGRAHERDVMDALHRFEPFCDLMRLAGVDSKIKYLLIHNGVLPAVFQEDVKRGDVKLIFEASGVTFYELRCFGP